MSFIEQNPKVIFVLIKLFLTSMSTINSYNHTNSNPTHGHMLFNTIEKYLPNEDLMNKYWNTN